MTTDRLVSRRHSTRRWPRHAARAAVTAALSFALTTAPGSSWSQDPASARSLEVTAAGIAAPIRQPPWVAQVSGEDDEPAHDPEEVRGRADDILARPEYQEPKPSIFQRVLAEAGEFLGRLLSSTAGAGGGLGGWLILISLIGLVVWLVQRIQIAAPSMAIPGQSIESEVSERRTAAEWEADAERHEAEGNWVAALRCRYRALVATLDDLGVVRDIPGRTVGEYRQELADRVPSVAQAFADTTSIYEDAWYGHRQVGPDDSARFASGVSSLVAEVGR